MLRRAALLCLVLALWTAPAQAACFDSDDAFMTWVEAYGPNPDPTRLGCAVQYLAGSRLFQDKALRRPLAHFFSAALFRAPAAARERAAQELAAAPDENVRVIFLNAVWYGDSPESRAFLGRLREAWPSPTLAGLVAGQLSSTPRQLLGNLAPQNEAELEQVAQDLDCLWMRYLGSDDTAYVDRIVQAGLLSVHADSGGASLLGYAARWSLRSNLRSPRVRTLLEARFQKASGDEWALLDNVLHGKRGEEPPAKK